MGFRRLLTEKKLRCGFCGRDKSEVPKFISGPSVYICSYCVELCVEILSQEAEENPQQERVFPTESMSFKENQALNALAALKDLADLVQDRFGVDVMELRLEHQGRLLRFVAQRRSGGVFTFERDLQ